MNGCVPKASEADALSVVRHLSYLHQEVVRLRLHFLTWIIEMALLHMETEYPALGEDIAHAKTRFRF